MSGKADFTAEEWETVLRGPTTAGLIVTTAQRGGTFRETFAMTQSYVEARKQHGQSQLLDEIVAANPAVDHTRYHSPDELKTEGLQHLRAAVDVLEQKASGEEVDAYRRFVLELATRVASAHRENGREVSDLEQAALDQIGATLTPAA